MIYPIVKFGDPVLEREGETVTEFDTPELHKFLEDMFESMYAAKGVGLAAPQIGIGKKIAVIDVSNGENPADKLVLINPNIVHIEGKQVGEEGCLSIPGFREQVRRARVVTTRAQNAKGEAFEVTGEDLLARALLHETEHLQGRLYITHISALKRDLIKRKIKKKQRAGEWGWGGCAWSFGECRHSRCRRWTEWWKPAMKFWRW